MDWQIAYILFFNDATYIFLARWGDYTSDMHLVQYHFQFRKYLHC